MRACELVLAGSRTGINWVRRFNEEGIAGLEDRPKAGRPTYP